MSNQRCRFYTLLSLVVIIQSTFYGAVESNAQVAPAETLPNQTQPLASDFVTRSVPDDLLEPGKWTGEPADVEIFGGIETKSEDLVMLRLPNNDTKEKDQLCSGLLLRGDTILTAAHCLCSKGKPLKRAPFVVSASADNFSDNDQWMEAADFTLYPGWSCANMGTVADLAVVFLKPNLDREKFHDVARINGDTYRAFKRCRSIDAATPPNERIPRLVDLIRNSPPKSFIVQGFGLAENNKSGVPKEVSLSITSLICNTLSARLRGCRPFREMILGADNRDQGVRDACGGDSGGPVLLVRSDGERVPVGIVSRGVRPLVGEPDIRCGLGGVYTHLGIPNVIKWIEELDIQADICG